MGQRLSRAETARRLKIYNETANDNQAAKKAHLTPMGWRLWRQSHALPPKGKVRSKSIRSMARGLEALYSSRTVVEAAAKLGVDLQDLPLIGAPVRRDATAGGDPVVRALYRNGWWDPEVARHLGWHVSSVRRYRLKHWPNLRRDPGLSPTEEKRRYKAYKETASDVAAAKHLQMSRSGFRIWRISRGLE